MVLLFRSVITCGGILPAVVRGVVDEDELALLQLVALLPEPVDRSVATERGPADSAAHRIIRPVQKPVLKVDPENKI